MKYELLVYTKPGSFESLSQEEQQKVHGQYMAVTEAPGIVGGEQLGPLATATTVRVDDGRTLVTDGPFADTKEVFGGFYLLDAENIDRAIEVASKVPSTWLGGSVEIRPLAAMENGN
jgi:hypothetical protein